MCNGACYLLGLFRVRMSIVTHGKKCVSSSFRMQHAEYVFWQGVRTFFIAGESRLFRDPRQEGWIGGWPRECRDRENSIFFGRCCFEGLWIRVARPSVCRSVPAAAARCNRLHRRDEGWGSARARYNTMPCEFGSLIVRKRGGMLNF